MDKRTTALMWASGNDNTETPDELFAELDREFNFVADMAATKENRKCYEYFGPDHHDTYRRDCLTADPWPVGTVWMNPPYSDAERACVKNCKKKRCVVRGFHLEQDKPGCADFVAAAAKWQKKGTTTVCLLASRTDTSWWHRHVWNDKTGRFRPGVSVRFIKGRLVFEGQKNGAPFPSVIVVFKGKACA